jgi:type I restriction enzyme S subunit
LYKGEFGSALIGTSLTCFRANPQKFTPEYLYLALQGTRFQNQLTANMSQTTRNQVPITAQRKLKIVRPPLAQQRKVSKVLENLAAERERCFISLRRHNHLFGSLQHRAFRGELNASSLKEAAA